MNYLINFNPTSEPGYASYNVTDKQILVFLDITKIMGSLKSKAAIDPLEQIMALLQNGIPVNYEIAPDGKSARVYIDKALVVFSIASGKAFSIDLTIVPFRLKRHLRKFSQRRQ